MEALFTAELKEDEGKFVQAINLYLSGGMPGKAAAVVSNQPQLASNQQLMEAIASALFKAHMFEKAGDFFEKLGSNDRALDAYRGGHAFGRAVELARKKFPSEVVNLEEVCGWGFLPPFPVSFGASLFFSVQVKLCCNCF